MRRPTSARCGHRTRRPEKWASPVHNAPSAFDVARLVSQQPAQTKHPNRPPSVKVQRPRSSEVAAETWGISCASSTTPWMAFPPLTRPESAATLRKRPSRAMMLARSSRRPAWAERHRSIQMGSNPFLADLQRPIHIGRLEDSLSYVSNDSCGEISVAAKRIDPELQLEDVYTMLRLAMASLPKTPEGSPVTQTLVGSEAKAEVLLRDHDRAQTNAESSARAQLSDMEAKLSMTMSSLLQTQQLSLAAGNLDRDEEQTKHLFVDHARSIESSVYEKLFHVEAMQHMLVEESDIGHPECLDSRVSSMERCLESVLTPSQKYSESTPAVYAHARVREERQPLTDSQQIQQLDEVTQARPIREEQNQMQTTRFKPLSFIEQAEVERSKVETGNIWKAFASDAKTHPWVKDAVRDEVAKQQILLREQSPTVHQASDGEARTKSEMSELAERLAACMMEHQADSTDPLSKHPRCNSVGCTDPRYVSEQLEARSEKTLSDCSISNIDDVAACCVSTALHTVAPQFEPETIGDSVFIGRQTNSRSSQWSVRSLLDELGQRSRTATHPDEFSGNCVSQAPVIAPTGKKHFQPSALDDSVVGGANIRNGKSFRGFLSDVEHQSSISPHELIGASPETSCLGSRVEKTVRNSKEIADGGSLIESSASASLSCCRDAEKMLLHLHPPGRDDRFRDPTSADVASVADLQDASLRHVAEQSLFEAFRDLTYARGSHQTGMSSAADVGSVIDSESSIRHIVQRNCLALRDMLPQCANEQATNSSVADIRLVMEPESSIHLAHTKSCEIFRDPCSLLSHQQMSDCECSESVATTTASGFGAICDVVQQSWSLDVSRDLISVQPNQAIFQKTNEAGSVVNESSHLDARIGFSCKTYSTDCADSQPGWPQCQAPANSGHIACSISECGESVATTVASGFGAICDVVQQSCRESCLDLVSLRGNEQQINSGAADIGSAIESGESAQTGCFDTARDLVSAQSGRDISQQIDEAEHASEDMNKLGHLGFSCETDSTDCDLPQLQTLANGRHFTSSISECSGSVATTADAGFGAICDVVKQSCLESFRDLVLVRGNEQTDNSSAANVGSVDIFRDPISVQSNKELPQKVNEAGSVGKDSNNLDGRLRCSGWPQCQALANNRNVGSSISESSENVATTKASGFGAICDVTSCSMSEVLVELLGTKQDLQLEGSDPHPKSAVITTEVVEHKASSILDVAATVADPHSFSISKINMPSRGTSGNIAYRWRPPFPYGLTTPTYVGTASSDHGSLVSGSVVSLRADADLAYLAQQSTNRISDWIASAMALREADHAPLAVIGKGSSGEALSSISAVRTGSGASSTGFLQERYEDAKDEQSFASSCAKSFKAGFVRTIRESVRTGSDLNRDSEHSANEVQHELMMMHMRNEELRKQLRNR